MKKVSPAKEKSVKVETTKKVVTSAPVVKVEDVKQETLAEVKKEEPAVEKKAVKKTVAKKTVEKKAVVSKTAEKKEVATVKEEIFVQYSNQEVFAADVVERVKNAFIAEGHAVDSIEKVRVYIKPEENMIYYVVNDDYASGISLF